MNKEEKVCVRGCVHRILGKLGNDFANEWVGFLSEENKVCAWESILNQKVFNLGKGGVFTTEHALLERFLDVICHARY